MKTYTEPGPLRVQCEKCKIYIHISHKHCACGNDLRLQFKRKKEYLRKNKEKLRQERLKENLKKKIADPPTEAETLLANILGCAKLRMAYVIGNPPSWKIKSSKIEDVEKLFHKIVDAGKKRGAFYSPQAIKHWLGHRFQFGSKAHKNACRAVDKIVEQIFMDKGFDAEGSPLN